MHGIVTELEIEIDRVTQGLHDRQDSFFHLSTIWAVTHHEELNLRLVCLLDIGNIYFRRVDSRVITTGLLILLGLLLEILDIHATWVEEGTVLGNIGNSFLTISQIDHDLVKPFLLRNLLDRNLLPLVYQIPVDKLRSLDLGLIYAKRLCSIILWFPQSTSRSSQNHKQAQQK